MLILIMHLGYEVTDSSNREQFVICLRWVDEVTNEDLIGLYQVDDITAATLFSSCLA